MRNLDKIVEGWFVKIYEFTIAKIERLSIIFFLWVRVNVIVKEANTTNGWTISFDLFVLSLFT